MQETIVFTSNLLIVMHLHTKCIFPTNTTNTLRGTEIHSKANKYAFKQAQIHALSARERRMTFYDDEDHNC